MNRRLFDWPLVDESSRNGKKRIVSKILPIAPILYFSSPGIAVQILKAIMFFISRRFIYERSDTNIRDWSLAYSFLCAVVWSRSPLTLVARKQPTTYWWQPVARVGLTGVFRLAIFLWKDCGQNHLSIDVILIITTNK